MLFYEEFMYDLKTNCIKNNIEITPEKFQHIKKDLYISWIDTYLSETLEELNKKNGVK